MKKIILFIVATLLVISAVPIVAFADSPLKITSRQAVLMSEQGVVVFEKNATDKRPIASMTKIMTLLCTYDAINSGKVSLDDDVVVSHRSASMGGSQVFLEENGSYKLSQLIKSIIVCSANDSCVAVAEHVSGSVESFVELMNNKANELHLVASNFVNCTGLPDVSQYSCAMDVATMLRHLIANTHYFSCANIWTEDFVHPSGRITGMTNTNKLVRFYEGCDGGKTGFTNEAMHCLSATAKRGETRLIAVVVGAPDSKTRFKETSDMLNYGFANYVNKVYCDGGLENVEVLCGKQNSVEVNVKNKLVAFTKKGENNYSVVIDVQKQITAPISVGDVVGTAYLVDGNNNVVNQTEVVACGNVESLSYFDYVRKVVGAY